MLNISEFYIAHLSTFHDRDVAPELETIQDTNDLLDKVTDYMLQKQKQVILLVIAKTGIKLLWGTANLFSAPKYACGAATNPDALVFAHAAAQVKQASNFNVCKTSSEGDS